jgi:hypothetical protein
VPQLSATVASLDPMMTTAPHAGAPADFLPSALVPGEAAARGGIRPRPRVGDVSPM